MFLLARSSCSLSPEEREGVGKFRSGGVLIGAESPKLGAGLGDFQEDNGVNISMEGYYFFLCSYSWWASNIWN